VLRGMGGSSDGKGKGITAPNPIGQKFAIERAWENAGLSPATVTMIEGHGTSTAWAMSSKCRA
jgi:acyl transferase domain-containing protein